MNKVLGCSHKPTGPSEAQGRGYVAPAVPIAKTGPYRVLCFGDSVTVGFHQGGQGYEPYGRTLAKALIDGGAACDVCALGLCGLTSQEMLESLNHRVVKDRVGRYGKGLIRAIEDDGPFDMVILMAGTNDIGMNLPTDKICAWTADLHKVCTEHGLPTVVVLPPTVTKGQARANLLQLQTLIRAWVKTCATLAAALGSGAVPILLDSEELVPRTLPGHWEPEEFHLAPLGSQELGRRLAVVIGPLLSTLRPPSPGGGQCRILEPTSASLDLVGQPDYSPGDAVDVFSRSRSCWCAGKVIGVTGPRANQQVEVEMHLGGGHVARKVLPANNDHLRRAKLAPPASPGPGPVAVPAAAASPASPIPRPPLGAGSPTMSQGQSRTSLEASKISSGLAAGAAIVSPAGTPAGAASPAGLASPAQAAVIASPVRVPTVAPGVTSPKAFTSPAQAASLGPGLLGPSRSPMPAAIGSPAVRPTTVLAMPEAAIIEGADVEVYSKRHKAWCPGKVKQIIEAADPSKCRAVVSMMLPNGTGATKTLPPVCGAELRLATSASCRMDVPLSSMSQVPLASYKVDDVVQVWSNSHCCWCDGKVTGVDSSLVQAKFLLPGDVEAQKSIVPSQGGIRRPQGGAPAAASVRPPPAIAMPPDMGAKDACMPGALRKLSEASPGSDVDDLEIDYQGGLGPLALDGHRTEPYLVGDDVEVWSNSNQAWCPGKVTSVENGLVSSTFVLPNGQYATKPLPPEEVETGLRLVGRVAALTG